MLAVHRVPGIYKRESWGGGGVESRERREWGPKEIGGKKRFMGETREGAGKAELRKRRGARKKRGGR